MADHAIRPGNSGIQSSPRYAAITPADGTDLPYITRGIYVGGAGNIVIQSLADGASITFTAVPVGKILPVQTQRVLATGTTATALVALY